MDAGLGPVLRLDQNPNNVLSAVGALESQLPVASVHVAIQSPSGSSASTPEQPVTGGNAVVPVLGLKPSTTYQMEAVVTLTDGGSATSPEVSFTTLALPDHVHQFHTVSIGEPGPGFNMVARLPTTAAMGVDSLTITDSTGTPVWYLDTEPGLVGDFQKQPDHTYTVAVDDLAHAIQGLQDSVATYHQYDVLGNLLHTWTAPAPSVATDCHDLRIQPNGDALLFGMVTQTVDMRPYADGGQPDATVVGNILYRLAPDGGVRFSWNTFDHLSLHAIDPTVPRTGALVDAIHANSIDVTADGNYLISLRDMSQVVKINAADGGVMWKLGGANDDGTPAGDFTFVDDPLNGPSCQHAARELPNGDIILFDDGNGHTPPNSRAAEYALAFDPSTGAPTTATLVWSAGGAPSPLASYALGYAQRLDNGDTLITYGTNSRVQEVDADGNLVWELTDPMHGFGIYRTVRIDSLY